MNDEDRECRENKSKAKLVESNKGVQWPDDTILVLIDIRIPKIDETDGNTYTVEELAVLLQHLHSCPLVTRSHLKQATEERSLTV